MYGQIWNGVREQGDQQTWLGYTSSVGIPAEFCQKLEEGYSKRQKVRLLDTQEMYVNFWPPRK